MSRAFQCKAIPSSWLELNGRRLDCGPYMSGAIEAKELLKRLTTEKLHQLTKGHHGGIFNGPRFARTYVNDAMHGVPFLGSTDILGADFSYLTLLSKKQATASPDLLIDEDWTLITCSGTVGRMAFSRPDMRGMAGSQHFMRVVADENKIKPGYLYAYLSSRFGVPIVVSGTYGAIIQHIEPHHLSDLPVPRFGEFEATVDDLIMQSKSLLTLYQDNVVAATTLLFESVGLKDITATEWHEWGADLGFVTRPSVQSLRAINFNPRFNRLVERIKSGPWKRLIDVCSADSLHRGSRFTRVDAEPEYAYKLVGQKELFWLRPEGRWIAKKYIPDDVLVQPGSILVAAQGTLGESELYCRSEFIWDKAIENAYSEHLLRVISDEAVMPSGSLFAFMRSETAFRMLRSISVGSKLQDHHYSLLPELPVPYPPEPIRIKCHELIVEAYDAKHKAVKLEDEARALVEKAIEEGAR